MKKTILSTMMIALALPVMSAHAVEDGITESEQAYPQFVKTQGGCSSTLLAGKWALTAAHCEDDAFGVITWDGQNVGTKTFHINPDYYVANGVDGIGIKG